jgi:hypothetical protein
LSTRVTQPFTGFERMNMRSHLIKYVLQNLSS